MRREQVTIKGYQMNYMLIEKIRLAYSYILTRLLFRPARLIRFPSVFRGKNLIRFGSGFTTGYFCRIDVVHNFNNSDSVIFFGDDVQINDSVHIAAGCKIEIGNGVLIASRVFITDHNHGSFPVEAEYKLRPSLRALTFSPVKIEDNVWVGEGVCILPGVTIGSGSIVGAGSVVTKCLPPHTISVGNPARPIKRFDFNNCEWVPF